MCQEKIIYLNLFIIFIPIYIYTSGVCFVKIYYSNSRYIYNNYDNNRLNTINRNVY